MSLRVYFLVFGFPVVVLGLFMVFGQNTLSSALAGIAVTLFGAWLMAMFREVLKPDWRAIRSGLLLCSILSFTASGVVLNMKLKQPVIAAAIILIAYLLYRIWGEVQKRMPRY